MAITITGNNNQNNYGIGYKSNEFTFNLSGNNDSFNFYSDLNDQGNPNNSLFKIQADGKVGIGTNSPSETLEVDGNTIINGNLGIGTTTAQSSLHIFDKNDGDGTIAKINITGESQEHAMLFIGQSESFGGGILYNADDNPDIIENQDDIVFFRRDNNVDHTVFKIDYNDNDITYKGKPKYTENTNWSNDSSGPSFRRWPAPDWDSGWQNISSQAGANSFKQLAHTLGQYPSFVKVLIKDASAGDNAYIFEAGGVNTTDDESDHYGGLVYGYNKNNIRIWVPDRFNNGSNGRVINIQDGWGGEQNNVIIQNAKIRVLMWK